jgi:hypothetical protein
MCSRQLCLCRSTDVHPDGQGSCCVMCQWLGLPATAPHTATATAELFLLSMQCSRGALWVGGRKDGCCFLVGSCLQLVVLCCKVWL